MTISTTPTGAELMAHLDTLIGDRWVTPTTWKRIEYPRYQITVLPFATWIAKDAAMGYRKKGPCVRWADLTRSAFQLWADKYNINPIAMGSISALHVGFHHPPASRPNKGHRLNWTLDEKGKLWFLDVSFHTAPEQSRWVYPLNDADSGFFSLYA